MKGWPREPFKFYSNLGCSMILGFYETNGLVDFPTYCLPVLPFCSFSQLPNE